MNELSLMGKLVEDAVLTEQENGKITSEIILAVDRKHNQNNEQDEKDYLKINLIGETAKNVAEYCRSGDTIGVRGKVRSDLVKNENGETDFKLSIIAERVVFLAHKKEHNKSFENER